MKAVLRINCPEVRERLKNAGLELCPCCEFEDSVWLNVSSDKIVHGLGYAYYEDWKIEDTLDYIEEELKKSMVIDCKWDIKKFIKTALENVNEN